MSVNSLCAERFTRAKSTNPLIARFSCTKGRFCPALKDRVNHSSLGRESPECRARALIPRLGFPLRAHSRETERVICARLLLRAAVAPCSREKSNVCSRGTREIRAHSCLNRIRARAAPAAPKQRCQPLLPSPAPQKQPQDRCEPAAIAESCKPKSSNRNLSVPLN